MRALGIDLGRRRVGFALSDSLKILATPFKTVEISSDEQLFDIIKEIVVRNDVTEIVIGLPLLLSGDMGTEAKRTEHITSALKELIPTIKITLLDERFSSFRANELMIESGKKNVKRSKDMDKIAAALILQSYLDNLKKE